MDPLLPVINGTLLDRHVPFSRRLTTLPQPPTSPRSDRRRFLNSENLKLTQVRVTAVRPWGEGAPSDNTRPVDLDVGGVTGHQG